MELSRKRIAIIAGVGLVILAAIIIPVAYFAATEDSDDEKKEKEADKLMRVDCYPEASSPAVKLTKEECEKRGCHYDPEAAAGATPGVACYYPAKGGFRFSVDSRESTGQGFRLHLKSSGTAPFRGHFRKPVLDVQMVSNTLLRFTFDDRYASPPRYRVPVSFNLPSTGADNPKYLFKVTDASKLSFTITRNSTGTVIFDTGVGGLVLTDQFLQLVTKLPSTNLYGMGEHSRNTFRRRFDSPNSWPAFARDQPPGGDNNLYGVHPFYTCVEDSAGNSHGVLLLNSNAQEYTFSPGPRVTWRTIGGVLDFFVIIGSNPEDVVQQYQEMVGRPMMPPYWALGFQLCRYGYKNLTDIQTAVEETKRYNIPHDVQYADIDHMDERMDFTIDTVNFGGLSDYFNTLRADGMRTIIILDPCFITNVTGYEPYDEIKRVKGSVMWPADFDIPDNSSDEDGALLGYVWPRGKVVFPDFFKTETQAVWQNLIVKHRSNLSFDGLWIDMNEPASFGTNLEKPWNWPDDAKPYWSLHCKNNKWDDPPYRPLAAYYFDEENRQNPLADKTICMNAVQGERGQFRHYDVHSLYGWSQTAPTLRAARAATGERSLVVTRSTFPGSGQHAGHWLGDNYSKWSHLRQSIIGMLDFNLFGIPYVGADICGFNDNTTEELCLRWMQLGAFYPYCRNHNGIGLNAQHPGAFGESFGAASREILETRYWLLPYLYTLFHMAHTEGKTVVRPLHHEFPTDNRALSIDRQFLWGPALLISPILEEGQTELRYYLPSGRWYDFYTGQVSTGPADRNEPISNMYSKPALHLRGGHVVALQSPANNTHFSRQNVFQIRAMLDKPDTDGGVAAGALFWDDGSSIDTYENGNYFLAKYTVADRNLNVEVKANNGVSDVTGLYYGDVIVYGVTLVDDVVVHTSSGTFKPHYSLDETAQILNVTLNETFSLSESFLISWGVRDNTSERVDCFPDARSEAVELSRGACEQRGCKFDDISVVSADGSVPCYYPFTGGLRYSVKRQETTENGWRFLMTFSGKSPFGGDFKSHPMLDVFMLSNDLLRFTFYEMNENPPRFRVPLDLNLPNKTADNPMYEFKMVDPSRMAFTVTRKDTGTVIFDTGVGGLVLTDQFLQLVTRLPSTNVYGLGEHSRSTFRRRFDSPNSWPAFSRDEPPGGDSNLYGVHPFYTCVEDSEGNTHGVFLLNSNAQEYALSPEPMLTWRTIGGVLDFFIFMGSNPETVVQQYTELVGRPMMPPYWALGFQLCRYGYNNLTNMQRAVEETKRYNIPHDVQYADIDHMDERMDFTIDTVNFGGLSDYFNTLRADGMRTIIILDPCFITNVTGYEPYDEIKRVKGSVMWPAGFDIPDNSSDEDGALLGYVWPKGKVVFPDYFKNATQELWTDLIVKHHAKLTFDGIWIDMNEPANFGTNLEKPWNWPDDAKPYWSLHCRNNKWDDPPYRPLAAYYHDRGNTKTPLAGKTICMNAVQGDSGQFRQYDVHSLYGWSQTAPTLRAARAATGERSLVISRSTFPGSGKHAGHWLGDNNSIWVHLRESIVGMLDFNLFGIPYIGADICGFFGDTNEELCLRWMQLGAFYPFSRNHNGLGSSEQHPGALGDRVGTASREILETRYWLLPYLYTMFHRAHTLGTTVIRPLHHEFPRDNATLSIDQQFMWGHALLISPILYENQTELEFYLPSGIWYQFYTGEMSRGPAFKKVAVDFMSKPELHMRAGHVIVMQQPANNTHFSRQNPFEIRVMVDPEIQSAGGALFWDDGVSVDTFESGNHIEVGYVAMKGSFRVYLTGSFAGASSLHYERVLVYGITSATSVNVTMKPSESTYNPTFTLDNQILNVTLDAAVNKLSEEFEVTWQ